MDVFDFKQYQDWDAYIEPEISSLAYIFLVSCASIPVFLFFSLWAWLGNTMRNVILLSNSVLHGSGYLEYAKEVLVDFFKKNNVKEVTFVPYANVESQTNYTNKFRSTLKPWGFDVCGLNETDDPVAAINKAQCVFVGGGNTFLLLKTLQDNGLVEVIRRRVLEEGMPYIGSSAGTNVATVSINTTNDMPIVHCKSFDAIGLVPFNINPHYLDADPRSTHQGETRETRIQEYHCLPRSPPVLGLREGSYLNVEGNKATLGGHFPARLFIQGKATQEFPVGSDLSFLLDASSS